MTVVLFFAINRSTEKVLPTKELPQYRGSPKMDPNRFQRQTRF